MVMNNTFYFQEEFNMVQHNDSTHTGGGVILRHVILIVGAAGLLVALFLLTQNITLSTFGVVAIVLAHVIAVTGILLSGRSILRTFVQRIHGTPPTHDSDHGHQHGQATAGHVIRWAWLYDVFVSFLMLGQQKKILRSTLAAAQIQPNDSILDVGCGPGTMALLAKSDHPTVNVYGIDAGEEMIALAQQKATRQGTDIDFRLGLAQELPYPDASFDVVMNSLVMHHLPQEVRDQAVVEMYRVLKPGGRLLIVEFEPPKNRLYRAFLSLLIGRMTGIDNSYLAPLLEDAGFTQVSNVSTGGTLTISVSGQKPRE
jgi:ubiquinone/menaquinone biosynthesis C-methylase UbiE